MVAILQTCRWKAKNPAGLGYDAISIDPNAAFDMYQAFKTAYKSTRDQKKTCLGPLLYPADPLELRT
eukprot:692452-Karenia_brevis.AAC.1